MSDKIAKKPLPVFPQTRNLVTALRRAEKLLRLGHVHHGVSVDRFGTEAAGSRSKEVCGVCLSAALSRAGLTNVDDRCKVTEVLDKIVDDQRSAIMWFTYDNPSLNSVSSVIRRAIDRLKRSAVTP